MTNSILIDLLNANEKKTLAVFDKLTVENSTFQLNEAAASAGFYMRHVAEAQLMLTKSLFGVDVQLPYAKPSTLRVAKDEGLVYDLTETKHVLHLGFDALRQLISNMPAEDWQKVTEKPFFGEISNIDALARILNHNAHHAGQIELSIKKGHSI